MLRDISQSDLTRSLAGAIAGLEDEDRLILKLYYFDGLKLKEIASMFGYHEATASRKLTRLQADIRRSVEEKLQADHGWTATDVKRHLAETAAGLGVNIETMFAALMLMLIVQEMLHGGVL